jgi:hypothetical protein
VRPGIHFCTITTVRVCDSNGSRLSVARARDLAGKRVSAFHPLHFRDWKHRLHVQLPRGGGAREMRQGSSLSERPCRHVRPRVNTRPMRSIYLRAVTRRYFTPLDRSPAACNELPRSMDPSGFRPRWLWLALPTAPPLAGELSRAERVTEGELNTEPPPSVSLRSTTSPAGGGRVGNRALHAQSLPSHSLGSASLKNLPCGGCVHDKRVSGRSNCVPKINLIWSAGILPALCLCREKSGRDARAPAKTPTELRPANPRFACFALRRGDRRRAHLHWADALFQNEWLRQRFRHP